MQSSGTEFYWVAKGGVRGKNLIKNVPKGSTDQVSQWGSEPLSKHP